MKLFTKDTFGYLFQAAVIIFLFSYSPVAYHNQILDNSISKNLRNTQPDIRLNIINKPDKINIEPEIYNYIFKKKSSANKLLKINQNNFDTTNINEQFAQPFKIGFSQLVLK